MAAEHKEDPDIRRAWNYFYGRSLPRREVEERDESNMPVSWRKLEPVEPGGELYPLNTPLKELGDFGLGVGLYFSSRFAMMIMFSLIGFLNAFTIMAYYRSDAYAGDGSKDHLSYDLRTSAICERTLKVCLNWECTEKGRRADCPMLMFEDGFMDIASVGILLSYLALVTMSQQHIADNVDVREQTASDYSIVVADPDPDAIDPEEWRRYFSPFGHVTYVSVGVDNGQLLQLLARKRSVLMQLHTEVSRGQEPRADNQEGEGGEGPQASDDRGGGKSRRTSMMDQILASAKASQSYYQAVETEEPAADSGGKETGGDSNQGAESGFLSKLGLQGNGVGLGSWDLPRGRGSIMGSWDVGNKRGSFTRSDWAEEDEKQLDDMVEKELNSEAAQVKREQDEALAAKEEAERGLLDNLWLAVQRLGVMQDAKFFRAEMISLERQIEAEMNKGSAKVSKVFVTFETEEAQREALGTLKLGLLSAKLNLDMQHKDRFRFSNVLTIDEAPEPRDIMWCELNTSPLQLAVSLVEGVVACAGFILLAYLLLLLVWPVPALVGVCVAVLNMAVAPLMISVATRERHVTRESESAWLLGKLVIARWFVTVFLVKSMIPFGETLSVHSIATIRSILICDAFFKPVIQVLDLPGLIDHYIIAPFSPTQEKMNRLFLGARWSLTERYSDMGKSIFLALSFAAVYPFGYWVCAAANLASFMSDKYCLFRVWRPTEPENAAITSYHRATLAVAFLFHCIFTLGYFADWPFDDLCAKGDGDGDGEYVPDWVASKLSFDLADPQVHKHCNMQHTGWLFSIRGGRAYMTESQVTLIAIYKFVTIFTVFGVLIAYFGPSVVRAYRRVFIGHVHSTLPANDVPFSEVEFIEGYIPGLVDPVFNKPLLACSLEELNKDHIHWEGNWEAYNLYSATDFSGMLEEERRPFFGRIKFYPPNEEPTGSYGDYIRENHPHLVDLLNLDKPEENGDMENGGGGA